MIVLIEMQSNQLQFHKPSINLLLKEISLIKDKLSNLDNKINQEEGKCKYSNNFTNNDMRNSKEHVPQVSNNKSCQNRPLQQYIRLGGVNLGQ